MRTSTYVEATILTTVNVAAKIRQEAHIKATNSAEEHIQPAETSIRCNKNNQCYRPEIRSSNDHRVLSQCNTRLRLLYLLNISCFAAKFSRTTTMLRIFSSEGHYGLIVSLR